MKPALLLSCLSILLTFSFENHSNFRFPEFSFPVPELTPKQAIRQDSLQLLAQEFNALNTRIRDGTISEALARKEVVRLLPLLKRYYFQGKNKETKSRKSFPVKGYNYQAIGGTNGSGYLPKGYNFYQGNKHTGHPAHDIFVHDKDQNCLDDKTGKPVQVAAICDGIIVAAEPQWQAGSNLRGGVYILLYDPAEEILYYYAHNQQLLVKPGDRVRYGRTLATLGRTGANACQSRSPTHLHFMALKVTADAALPPLDVYKILKAL